MTLNYAITNALLSKEDYCVLRACLVSAFEKLFQLLSVSSISVGISGFFATLSVYVLLRITPNFRICLAVFLMSFSLYSLNKLTDVKEDAINMPERLNFLRGRKNFIIAYSVVAYSMCMLLAFLDKPSSVAITLFPLVANALYGSRLLPGVPRLKDIPIMKNVVVAMSWAFTTTLLPASHMVEGMAIVVPVFYFVLVKGFINTVLYDTRDVKGDRENEIRTLPVLMGRRNTVLILLAVNSTLLPMLVLFNSGAKLIATMLVLNGFACILYFGMNISPIAMDIFVDGEWMLACLTLMIINWAGLLA
jgi:4-hydroxybenzoate polyprenyltransferase